MAQNIYKNPADQAAAIQKQETVQPEKTALATQVNPKNIDWSKVWNDEESALVGKLTEDIDGDFRYSADPDDLEEEDEKITIADVLRESAKYHKIPLNRACELWTRGSGLTGKSSWADWVRFNALNE